MLNNKSRLDEMLKVYGSREAPYTFRVKWEDKTMNKNKKFSPVLVISCIACFVACAVLGVGIFAGDIFAEPVDGQSFVISAYAAGGEDMVIGNEAVTLSKTSPMVRISTAGCEFHSDGTNLSEANPLVPGEKTISKTLKNMSLNTMGIKVCGEKIKSFDISSSNGILDWFDFEGYDEGRGSGIKGDYLHMGKHFEGLEPFDESDIYTYVVSWYPDDDRLNSDLREYTGGVDRTVKNPGMQELEKLSEGYDALIKSDEDLNKYFGDTITLTIHYEDNSTEVVNIRISFDEEGFAYIKMTEASENVVVY